MSRLRVFFIMFAGVTLLYQLIFLMSVWLHPGEVLSAVVYWLTELATIGLVAWATVKGGSMGVRTLGRVGGWVYVGMSVLNVAFVFYRNYYISHVADLSMLWDDDFFSVMSYAGFAVSLVLTIALILFVAGTRVWLPIRIGLSVMLLVVFTVNNFFNSFVYENITVGYILAVVEWLAVLVLALIWPRR